MKRQRSQKQSLIAEFFFAVHPFSIGFPGPHVPTYRLYFQKGLQILNKFDLPQHPPASNKFLYFSEPEKVPSFRILSERSLAYQWSLYDSKHSEGEEFVESQPIDLAPFWNDLLSKKETIKPYEAVFKKSKCRLFYLVAAGNHKQIHQNIQKYFRITDPNNHPQPHQPPAKVLQFQGEPADSMISNGKEKEGSQLSLNDKIQTSTHAIEMQQNKPSSPTSNLVLSKTTSHFLIPDSPNRLKSDNKMGTSNNISILSKSESEVGDIINSQLVFNLSLEEVQIGREIEKRIKEIESPCKRKPQPQASPSVQEQLLARYRQQKLQRITDSQLLNEKGDIIITPIYHHLKYYIIFLAIIAIFTGLVFMNPQSKPFEPSPEIYTSSKKGRARGGRRRKGGKGRE